MHFKIIFKIRKTSTTVCNSGINLFEVAEQDNTRVLRIYTLERKTDVHCLDSVQGAISNKNNPSLFPSPKAFLRSAYFAVDRSGPQSVRNNLI